MDKIFDLLYASLVGYNAWAWMETGNNINGGVAVGVIFYVIFQFVRDVVKKGRVDEYS